LEIAEEHIPENVYELLLEEYPEPEIAEEDDTEKESSEDDEQEESTELTLEEKLEILDERISELRNSLLKAKTKLGGLNDDIEALQLTQKAELEIAKENWERTNKEFNEHIKPVKEAHKVAIKALKDSQKEKAKQLKSEIKSYENAIPLAEEEKLLLTNKGKLQLLLNNQDSIEKLRNRYIDAEVAKRSDYPIFMAVSERGGKNNSGDYMYLTDEDGNIVEDAFGNPEIDQDLVNHRVSRTELLSLAEAKPKMAMAAEPREKYLVKGKEPYIAEAFVQFAVEQGFDFWTN
jgi:type I restriction enzyme M protein